MTDQVYVTVRDEGPAPDQDGEVTVLNNTPMKLPNKIPQKTWEEAWDIIKRTPLRDTEVSVNEFGRAAVVRNNCSGGVLANNGKIYGMPSRSNQVMEIDPETKVIMNFGIVSVPNSGHACNGGVLAPNGFIYGVPCGLTSFLKINPDTKTVTEIPISHMNSGAIAAYAGGVLASNGKIYCIPSGSKQVLEIDPETDKTDMFGSVEGSYSGGILTPTGTIIGIPVDAKNILEIDPLTKSVTTFGDFNFSDQFMGGSNGS